MILGQKWVKMDLHRLQQRWRQEMNPSQAPILPKIRCKIYIFSMIYIWQNFTMFSSSLTVSTCEHHSHTVFSPKFCSDLNLLIWLSISLQILRCHVLRVSAFLSCWLFLVVPCWYKLYVAVAAVSADQFVELFLFSWKYFNFTVRTLHSTSEVVL